MTDLADLVAPLHGDPAGPDLSYDPGRAAIEDAFAVSADGERSQEVNWPQIIRQIRDQAQVTRDLWLGIYLARAGAMAGQLTTVAEGAQLLAGLLETLWDHVHPQLDEVGFIGRRSACDSLARNGEFLLPLRRVVLIAHPRLGSYSALDLERFDQEGEAAEGYGMFRTAIAQVDADEIEAAIDALDSVRDALRRADAVLVAEAGDDTGTDFQPAYQALARMRSAITKYSQAVAPEGEPETVEDGAAEPDATSVGPPRAAGAAAPGRIESRDDVLRALDAISDYYQRREPGSAVPIALKRAREWVPMSFIDVLRDIAPDSIGDARRVLMSKTMAEEAGLG